MGDPGTDKDVETDQALVEGARAGDRQAMVAIYDRWADRLYNHCFYLRLRHEDQARDLTQQTFVTAIRALDQLHEPARLGGWLFAIAHFEASRMAPARAAWDPAAEADTDAEAEAESVAVPLAGTAVDAELRREVWRLDWRAAAGLADIDRELLNLSHREGFRPSELGEITNLAPGAVRQRLGRVQEKLERMLGALLVARLGGAPGGPGCAQLEALLRGWDGGFTMEVRQRVSRHIDRCEACTARRRMLVTPEVLLPPLVPSPWHLRDRILSRLQLAVAGGRLPARPAHAPRPRPAAARRRLLPWVQSHVKALVLAALLLLFVWLGGWLALRGAPSPFLPGSPSGQAGGTRSSARGGATTGPGPAPLAAPPTTSSGPGGGADGTGSGGAAAAGTPPPLPGAAAPGGTPTTGAGPPTTQTASSTVGGRPGTTGPTGSTGPTPSSTRGRPTTTQAPPRSTLAASTTSTSIATTTTTTASTTTTTITVAPVLSLTITGTGAVAASDGAGNRVGSCGNQFDDTTTYCPWTVTPGTTLTLDAKPTPGRVPVWSGACAGNAGDTCTLTMNGDLDTAVAFTDPAATTTTAAALISASTPEISRKEI